MLAIMLHTLRQANTDTPRGHKEVRLAPWGFRVAPTQRPRAPHPETESSVLAPGCRSLTIPFLYPRTTMHLFNLKHIQREGTADCCIGTQRQLRAGQMHDGP